MRRGRSSSLLQTEEKDRERTWTKRIEGKTPSNIGSDFTETSLENIWFVAALPRVLRRRRSGLYYGRSRETAHRTPNPLCLSGDAESIIVSAFASSDSQVWSYEKNKKTCDNRFSISSSSKYPAADILIKYFNFPGT